LGALNTAVSVLEMPTVLLTMRLKLALLPTVALVPLSTTMPLVLRWMRLVLMFTPSEPSSTPQAVAEMLLLAMAEPAKEVGLSCPFSMPLAWRKSAATCATWWGIGSRWGRR